VRTDRNNNPTAFTTDVARTAGLIEGHDYVQGDSFTVPTPTGPLTLYTAKLLGDPIALTIKAIDQAGFYTHSGIERWSYMCMPQWLWQQQTRAIKIRIIGDMYAREGGTELRHLFAD
jgi:hypothetical protein